MVLVARAGETDIPAADVALRQKIDRLYDPDAAQDQITTTLGLLTEALHREVARLNQVRATSEELEALSQHADQTSRASGILAEIKGLFAGDTEAYHRLFLAPRIIPNKLREHFAQLPAQAGVRTKAEQILADVLAGATMAEAGKAHGLRFEEMTLQEPDTAEMPFPMEIEDPMISLAKPLKTGEIHKDIVETDREYQIVRLKSRREGRLKVEIVSAQRPVFENWFRKQAQGVDIVIEAPELYAQIKEKYAHVWWLAEMKRPSAK